MAIVRLIYARSHNLASLLIRHRDDGAKRRWSHAGVLMEPQPDYEIGHTVWEARAFRQVGPTPMDQFIERYAAWQIVEYDVPDPVKGLQWLDRMEGKPYAYATVLARAFGLHLDDKGMQCSEVVEGYLQACGLQRWRDGLHLVTPNASFNHLGGVCHKGPKI